MVKISDLVCSECGHITKDHFIWDREEPLPHCPECIKNRTEHCYIYRMVEMIGAPQVMFAPNFFSGMRSESEPYTKSIVQYTNEKGERREFDGKRDVKISEGE